MTDNHATRWKKQASAPAQTAAAWLAALLLFPLLLAGQNKPSFKVDEWVTAFAYSDSGRLAYATRNLFSENKVRLQRDDIWVADARGRKRRILEGRKFVRGTDAFSFSVRALRWSPDGSRLAAELATNEIPAGEVDPQPGVMTLLLDDSGREIPIQGADSTIAGATNPAWLSDGATVVFQLAAPEPSTLFTLSRVGPETGGPEPIFAGRLFVAVEWDAKRNAAVAVESTENGSGPLNLVALDLTAETSREMATLPDYAGGLALSRSGKKIAYWVDNEQLEIREVDSPGRVARVRVAIGTLAWPPDESRLLVKRGIARRTTSLAWVPVPEMAAEVSEKNPAMVEVVPQPILHGLTYRMMDIPPIGNSVAVVEPGGQNLLVFPLK